MGPRFRRGARTARRRTLIPQARALANRGQPASEASGLQRRGCVIGRVEERQEIGNPGDLEDPPGGSRRTDHHELAIFPTQDRARTNEDVNPAGVEEVHLTEVHDERSDTRPDRLLKNSGQSRGRRDVDLPAHEHARRPFSGAASTAKSLRPTFPRSRHRVSTTQAVISRTSERMSTSGVLGRRSSADSRPWQRTSRRQNASARVRSPDLCHLVRHAALDLSGIRGRRTPCC